MYIYIFKNINKKTFIQQYKSELYNHVKKDDFVIQ